LAVVSSSYPLRRVGGLLGVVSDISDLWLDFGMVV
jgi:hypothetical protein